MPSLYRWDIFFGKSSQLTEPYLSKLRIFDSVTQTLIAVCDGILAKKVPPSLRLLD